METRRLQIWDATPESNDPHHVPAWKRGDGFPDAEYQGPYMEGYEEPTKAMKANRPDLKSVRVGLILDHVKMRAAVFRQVVASRDDPRPTDIVTGGPYPREFSSWSTDPQSADLPDRIADCDVWAFIERDPTEAEKRTLELWQRECRQDELAAPAKAEPEAGPEYVFRRKGNKGDVWQIVFEGRELEPVRHLAGMTYLRALLARPGHDFSALELYQMENPPPPEAVAPHGRELAPEEREQYGTGGTPTRVMDLKTRQAAIKRKEELEDELQVPDLDIEGREQREVEFERLEKALTSGRVAWATGGATFEPKEDKQPRQAVAARIDAAIDALAEKPHGGNLTKHLRAVRKGKTLRYDGGFTWET